MTGSTVYAGGTFTNVAGQTRNRIAAFDATTGAISTTFAPSMSSEVTAIIPAGDGTSVYVGGKFTSAGGVAASKVTRLLVSSGAVVAPFKTATIAGSVRDLRLVHGQLIIAGEFTKVGAVTRGQMASLCPRGSGSAAPAGQSAVLG